MAVKRGNIKLVTKLLQEGADVNGKGALTGNTPLHIAAVMGHAKIISLLLESNAAIDEKNNFNTTPLAGAVLKGHCVVTQLLIDNNATINTLVTPENKTVLMLAVIHDCTKIVHLLLDARVDVDQVDADGDTALMWAVQGKHNAMVPLLLDNRATVDLKNGEGLTPLTMACIRGCSASAVKALLDKNADIEAKTARYV